MALYNDTTTLSGLLKRVYSDKIEKVIYEENILTQAIPFDGNMEIGEAYYVPINVGLENGVTYVGPGGSTALQPAVAGLTVQARVDSYQIAVQSEFSFEIAARLLKASNAQGFQKAADNIMDKLMQTARKRLELNFLYGGSYISTVYTSSSGATVYLDPDQFAAYHWQGSIGVWLDFYSAAGVYKGTGQVTNVDLVNKKITINNAGISWTTGTAGSGDRIYFAGTYGNEAIGIDKIITTSGSLFGIDNTVYGDTWAGTTLAVGGNLVQNKLDDAAGLLMSKGGSGEYDLYVNNEIWGDLIREQHSRSLVSTGSGKQAYNFGSDSIAFWSQNGKINVHSHPGVKRSEGFLLKTDEFERIGCCDLKLGTPFAGDEPVVRLPNNLAYQVLAYSMQSLFCYAPAKQLKLTGITKA